MTGWRQRLTAIGRACSICSLAEPFWNGLARRRGSDHGEERRAGSEKMAGPTRLELATSGVTGRRSNQLNYDPAKGDACQPAAPTVTGDVRKRPSPPLAHGASPSTVANGGRYRIRTCDSRRVRPVLYR